MFYMHKVFKHECSDFFHRNGRLFVWECTIEPDDWVEWEPSAKKDKTEDSESEDDIDVEKAIERTEKQKTRTDVLLELGATKYFSSSFYSCMFVYK